MMSDRAQIWGQLKWQSFFFSLNSVVFRRSRSSSVSFLLIERKRKDFNCLSYQSLVSHLGGKFKFETLETFKKPQGQKWYLSQRKKWGGKTVVVEREVPFPPLVCGVFIPFPLNTIEVREYHHYMSAAAAGWKRSGVASHKKKQGRRRQNGELKTWQFQRMNPRNLWCDFFLRFSITRKEILSDDNIWFSFLSECVQQVALSYQCLVDVDASWHLTI